MEKRKTGRPPAGVNGDKVKDYPRLALRVPPEAKAQLQALSAIYNYPQWRIVTMAIDSFTYSLPAKEGERVNKLAEKLVRREHWPGRVFDSNLPSDGEQAATDELVSPPSASVQEEAGSPPNCRPWPEEDWR